MVILGGMTLTDCSESSREGRIMKLPIGDGMVEEDGNDDRLSFFLKSLPKIFFVPLVGMTSITGRILSGGDSDG